MRLYIKQRHLVEIQQLLKNKYVICLIGLLNKRVAGLNHKEIKMTLRYAKLSPDSGREALMNLGL